MKNENLTNEADDELKAQRMAYLKSLSLEQLKELKAQKQAMNTQSRNAMIDNPIVQGALSFGAGPLQYGADVGTAVANSIRNASASLSGQPTPAPYKIDIPAKYPALKTTGEIGASFLIPIPGFAAGSAIAKGVKYIPKIMEFAQKSPKIAKTAKNLTNSVASGAAVGALFGANNPDTTLAQDLALGAGVGGVAHAGVAGIQNALNSKNIPSSIYEIVAKHYAKKSQKPGSPLRSPAEVGQILETIGDSPVSFGEVIGSNSLTNRYQDYLRQVPFSGVEDASNQTIADANNAANKFVSELIGNADQTQIDKNLKEAIARDYKNLRKIKNQKYRDVGEYGESKNLQLKDLPDTEAKARQYLDDHIDSILSGSEPLLDKKSLGVISRIIKPKELLDKDVFNIATQMLSKEERAQLMREISSQTERQPKKLKIALENVKKYKNYSREEAKKGSALSEVYGELSDASQRDLERYLQESNDKDALRKYNSAKNFYKNEYLPYKNSDIQSVINKTGTPDRLENILLKGENAKVLSYLTENERKMLAAKKFWRVLDEDFEGNPTAIPAALKRAYEALTPKQKSVLFTPEQLKNLKNIETWAELTKEARVRNNPPKTGYLGNPLIKTAIGAAVGNEIAKGELSPISKLALYGAAPISAIMARGLRSKKLKESYANKAKDYELELQLKNEKPMVMKVQNQNKFDKNNNRARNALLYYLNDK